MIPQCCHLFLSLLLFLLLPIAVATIIVVEVVVVPTRNEFGNVPWLSARQRFWLYPSGQK